MKNTQYWDYSRNSIDFSWVGAYPFTKWKSTNGVSRRYTRSHKTMDRQKNRSNRRGMSWFADWVSNSRQLVYKCMSSLL